MEGFYSEAELKELGFKYCGSNVLVSKKTSIYGTKNISIGDNVRIDDFCVLIGNITIKNYVHLACFCSLHAADGSILIDNYTVIGSNVSIYSSEIDFEGNYMAGPLLPKDCTKKYNFDIFVGKHVIIGVNCAIIAGALIPDGVAVGAMSLVKTELQEWSIYAGVPCKKIRNRSKKLLDICKRIK